MRNIFKICLALVLFVAVTLPLLPFQMPAMRLERWWFKSLPFIWHKFICWLFGLRVVTKGEMASDRPLLLVANHVSWSDIVILGSLVQVCFVAKDEMESWPLFGWLAKLQRTIFIDRTSKQKAGEQSHIIAKRLMAGDVLVLFAEGTTSDGNKILPFKASLFGAAKLALAPDKPDAEVFVQPVSIAYVTHYGMPLGRFHRPIAGWPGNVGLGKHLFGLLFAGPIGVEVTFGSPIAVSKHTNRKQVAQKAEIAIKRMHEASLQRRPIDDPLQILTQNASNLDAKPLNALS